MAESDEKPPNEPMPAAVDSTGAAPEATPGGAPGEQASAPPELRREPRYVALLRKLRLAR